MTLEKPSNNPEKKEMLDDNALKFTLNDIGPGFLQENMARSFLLTTDWLEMGENNEKKLAHKKYENGNVEILLIQKFTENGRRTVPPKEKLTVEQYRELLPMSKRRVEKIRSEFNYTQSGTTFSMKYDEFLNSKLRILEVDAQNEALKNQFNPSEFPFNLTNVTGKIQYYGYRIAELVQ